MPNTWPLVPLGSAIRQRSEFVRIDDLQTYKRVRVQLHAKGIVLRDIVSGAEIKTKQQQVCQSGDFLIAEIDAKVGGFGIVPDDLAGAIVSSHYFLFEVNGSTIDTRFLDSFIRTPLFRDQVRAQGSTNYAAIRPIDVLGYKISLPPLDEQRRIVARIEQLSAKIRDASWLRAQAIAETEKVLNCQLSATVERLISETGFRTLGSLILNGGYGTSSKCYREKLKDAVPVLRIPNVASESVNLWDLKHAVLGADEFQRVKVQSGDILVVRTNGSSNLVGRCAVVPELNEPMAFASYLIRLRCDRGTIDPRYLQVMLKHLRTDGQLIDFARTTAGQYNVSLGRLRTANLPVPPLIRQRRTVAELDKLQAKVDALKELQTESAAELGALMPSILDKAFRGEL